MGSQTRRVSTGNPRRWDEKCRSSTSWDRCSWEDKRDPRKGGRGKEIRGQGFIRPWSAYWRCPRTRTRDLDPRSHAKKVYDKRNKGCHTALSTYVPRSTVGTHIGTTRAQLSRSFINFIIHQILNAPLWSNQYCVIVRFTCDEAMHGCPSNHHRVVCTVQQVDSATKLGGRAHLCIVRVVEILKISDLVIMPKV